MSCLKLSVLDFCSPAEGQTAGQRLHETLALAELVDGLGYERYWLAEHHTADAAHASPEILVPLVLARTRRLRAGPAGILLRYYSPLKVADTFSCIEALFPGRVDLGLARGAVDDRVARALLDGAAGDYARKVAELVDLLRPAPSFDSPPDGVRPIPPLVGPGPEVWVLASSGASAGLAADLGAALSLGLFLETPSGPPEPATVDAYRSRFRPGGELAAPRCNLAVAGICAETEAAAARLLAGHRDGHIVPNVYGTPDHCLDRLEYLAARYQVDEVVFAALGPRADDRRRAYELLAAEQAARSARAPQALLAS